ncbi:glycyl radical protein [Clostridium aminobutyricum]|uniref:Formate C-acetyltransferase/glycerol dehydratase family glycyl radical enzyme n=1 Tax=Clostridium aminobutyricum TaxID=33953 RepID=A0A939IHQ7_CLOAM|nr:formate C-acetyltransferase/glycerol dehydratase family glycyl radical enzyme [Clostridium aminobutyricum]MBN7774102.1 formate C-acetyltransferase/glycerol dehydratase family glycyl radical enzyme [Clostridium aminobutyricum]
MMTKRVEKLKKQQIEAKHTFSSERARLVTEAYEKFGSEPNILLKAKSLDYILENMTIYILDGELIVGNHTDKQRCAPIYPEFAAKWILDEIDEFTTRPVDRMVVSDEEKQAVIDVLKRWEGKSFDEVTADVLPIESIEAEKADAMTVGARDCATGHIIPNYWRLFDGGMTRIIEECEENIVKQKPVTCREEQEKVDFWQAGIITAKAAIKYANRFSKLAEELAEKEQNETRKRELLTISQNCNNVPEKGPSSFFEAVQFVWFMHIIVTIENNGHGNSLGPFDRYMNDYYVTDLKAGKITEDEAKEMLECLFIKMTDIIKLKNRFYSESFAAYPVWQNMIIGGIGADGKDGCNETTMLVLKANADVQTSQPTVSLRHHDNLSKEVFDMGVSMIQQGLSTPAFFNDKLVIPMVMNKFEGCTIEEARNWSITGCVQPNIAGFTDGRPQVGYVNYIKCIELAMNDGCDPVSKKMIGVKCGRFEDFETYEQFLEAFYSQLDYMYHLTLTGYTAVTSLHAVRQNMPFSSLLIDNCIEKGKSLQQGGAKYSESGVLGTGLANAMDSLAAVKKFVYDDKGVSPKELMHAIETNYEGNEALRLTLLNKAPKFGNDITEVDEIGRKIVAHVRIFIDQYRDSRGGRYTYDIESQSMNVVQGKSVGATPDGRPAGAPLADNVSPAMGRDVNGPTAAVLSVAHLDQINCNDGALFNLRFDSRSIAGKKGHDVIGGVIKTYFNHLGEHIQINVVSDETLRAAQEKPEDYRDLLVRVAGYMAYFTELDKGVQDAIISRTAHSAE